MTSIAVILPAFNEELTIVETITQFHEALPNAKIIVVDNNSQDNTFLLAKETLSKLSNSGFVIFERRQGKANAMRRAFLSIDADIYLVCDADMTYPANRALDLIEPILRSEADMVVGDRQSDGSYKSENKRKFHLFGNNLVQQVIKQLFKTGMNDVMSGYRALSRPFVKNYPILVEGFQVEVDMTLYALDKRYRILEIPIEYKDRPIGSFSKLNTISDGAKVIFAIIQIFRYYKPLAFFSGLSILFCILGLITAIPVFNDWIQFQYIHHVPLAILSAGIEILAALFFGIGLILDAIARNDKIRSELNLLRG